MNEEHEKLKQIELAVNKYYYALDMRKHGGVAQDKAFNEIQNVLGMNWKQGSIKKMVEESPELTEIYCA